ncbi:maestro heat-like repeat-containing protein family member 7 [Mustela erminea]|uniref:maestro heat-like repeat-containing protein family member 7 n=1 Tax=Mustela erminea TaxID=36723 RepID=UPI0013872DE1|nr:maestro heat-like repeat-containing protein family member 7 [Mustela erminea]
MRVTRSVLLPEAVFLAAQSGGSHKKPLLQSWTTGEFPWGWEEGKFSTRSPPPYGGRIALSPLFYPGPWGDPGAESSSLDHLLAWPAGAATGPGSAAPPGATRPRRSVSPGSEVPCVSGLRQSERDACEFILEFLEQGQVSQSDKLKFLRAVDTLSSAVRSQPNGNMNDYFPKSILAKKIEVLILEESTEVLVSNVRQQAMLCIVALSQVNPPFYLPQKLDLVNSCVSSTFSLPFIAPSLDRKESGSLYLQTIQALDDLLQALVMEGLDPSMALLQDFLEFFRKYLTPEERADVLMVSMEAMTSANRKDAFAASKMLKMILKYSMPEIGKVPEIIQYIYHNVNNITETTAQGTIEKILYLLAQTYTDEVILTLFRMEDQSQRVVHKPWEILASFPKGYEVIMEFLMQKLTPYQKSKEQETSHRMEISPLIATRAIQELLLEPSRRMEIHTFFSSLFMALLFRISFLVLEEDTDIQDEQHITGWVDPVSCSIEALKTLMLSTGYGDHVSYVQKLGGWELLTSPERHYEGVTLLARTMVIKNCWHNRPIFSFIISMLQDLNYRNHLTAFVFMAELLRCPGVAAIADEATLRILADWFQHEELTTVKLLLQMVVTFAKHGNMVRQFRVLQPYMLNCCYSLDSDIVTETFAVLKYLTQLLSWRQNASFFVQLSFTLGPFFEEESEHLRLMAFETYRALLAKVKRRMLVFPLKYQVLNLIVPLVLHLEDVNISVAQLLMRGIPVSPDLPACALPHGRHTGLVKAQSDFCRERCMDDPQSPAEAEGKQGPLVSEAVCGLLQEPTGLHPPDSHTVCRPDHPNP